MSEQEKKQIQELLGMVIDSIHVITERTSHIKNGDDFLLSPDNMFTLDGICMKLIFIGESIKNIDKISKGSIFSKYPSIPWKEIMKQRAYPFLTKPQNCGIPEDISLRQRIW